MFHVCNWYGTREGGEPPVAKEGRRIAQKPPTSHFWNLWGDSQQDEIESFRKLAGSAAVACQGVFVIFPLVSSCQSEKEEENVSNASIFGQRHNVGGSNETPNRRRRCWMQKKNEYTTPRLVLNHKTEAHTCTAMWLRISFLRHLITYWPFRRGGRGLAGSRKRKC